MTKDQLEEKKKKKALAQQSVDNGNVKAQGHVNHYGKDLCG